MIGPIYLTIYLFTSPLVSSRTALTPSALSIPPGVLSGHIFGMLFGFIVPTILMALPQPSVLSVSSKISALLVWQFFPLWSTILTAAWSTLVWPWLGRRHRDSHTAASDSSGAQQLRLLRTVYRFALAVSVPCHIAAWTLSLGSVVVPGLFAPHARETLRPTRVFVPPNPFDKTLRAASIAQGMHWFIQFDYLITSLAYLVSAAVTRYAPAANAGDFGLKGVLDILVRTIVLGPFATALSLLWDRDEAVFQAAAVAAPREQEAVEHRPKEISKG